jgi:hypothetical protein
MYAYEIEKYCYKYGKLEIEEPTEPVRWHEPQPNIDGEVPGVAGHGLSAYRWRRCRCAVCKAAKRRSAAVYRQRRKAQM